MNGVGVCILMSLTLAGRRHRRGIAKEDMGGDLQPRRVVVAVTVNHRSSRHRLQWQRQQQKGHNDMTDALDHAKKYSTIQVDANRLLIT